MVDGTDGCFVLNDWLLCVDEMDVVDCDDVMKR